MSKRKRQKRNFHLKKRPGMFSLAQETSQLFLQEASIAEEDKPAMDALFQFVHDHEYEFVQARAAGKPFERVLQELGFPLGMDEWKRRQQKDIPGASCSRCGVARKVVETAPEDARLLSHAVLPEASGSCFDCAVTGFFKNDTLLAQAVEINPLGKQMLLDPRVQQQFAGALQAAGADVKPEEINWQRVYDNWELPVPKGRKSREE